MLSSTPHSEINVDRQFWDYFDTATMVSDPPLNSTDEAELHAPEQGFVIGIYSGLLVTGAVGNVAVFSALLRSRRRKSRVNLLMTHLAVADLIVTFIVIPLEIGWKTTNAWLAGNLACKLFLVLRAFGLYLSSNVLVCISLDRFFAVLYPLRLPIARKRSKTMLSLAWTVAVLCSIPQSLVFRVMRHPRVTEFQQCVSFGAFSNQNHELAYNVFCLCAMYFVPLLIITVCYACIFYEISKNSKEMSDKRSSDNGRIQLRRSDERPLARARRRTLRMTVTIVTVFACCWLPYAIMTLWYMIDRESAENLSPRVQDLFFIMAVSNSCMDPLVYGSYALDIKTFFARTLRKVLRIRITSPELPGISAPGTLKSKLPTNATVHPQTVPPNREVRFEETSFGGETCPCSDPCQWSQPLLELNSALLKPSKSCETFTIPTNQHQMASKDNEMESFRFTISS